MTSSIQTSALQSVSILRTNIATKSKLILPYTIDQKFVFIYTELIYKLRYKGLPRRVRPRQGGLEFGYLSRRDLRC